VFAGWTELADEVLKMGDLLELLLGQQMECNFFSHMQSPEAYGIELQQDLAMGINCQYRLIFFTSDSDDLLTPRSMLYHTI
jgi:hypothetical protein